MNRFVAACVLTVASFCAARCTAAEAVRVEVRAGKVARKGVPVSFPLPESLRKYASFRLVEASMGKVIPVQVDGQQPPSVVWMHDQSSSAEAPLRYVLTPLDKVSDDAAPAVVVRRTARTLEVDVEGKPVLRYNHAVVASADPEKPYFSRSGFIHPLFDPQGNVLTDGMPAGTHMHQHAVMFAWVDTTFEGRPIDFWNSTKQQGEVRHAEIEAMASGPVYGEFRVRLEHVDLTAPAVPKVALNETWRVRVYRRTDGFLFDLHSTQACAGNSPLTVNKYHYGGMAFRGLGEWKGASGCQFLTSEGKTRETGNESRPRWCDISGPVAGGTSGATLFCNPQNLRANQPVRLHPSMPYFCFSPPIIDAFTIEPGRPLESRYRFYVHSGVLDTRVADAIGDDLAEPVQVELAGGE